MMIFTCTGETSGKASIGRLGRTTKPAPISSRTLKATNRRCDSANRDQTLEHHLPAPSRSRIPRSAEMPLTATSSLSVIAPATTT